MLSPEQLRSFPYTKLYPPLLGPDTFDRPHLLEQVRRAVLSRRLTLFSAPPGSGKTTLLASLPRVFSDLNLLWLSVDEEDNDPAAFMLLLLTALQQRFPGFGATTQAILATLSRLEVDLRRIMGVLINELVDLDPDPFVLVIDDLHFISEAAILDALDYLLERMPPAMHLVVATRYDPPLALSRLRLRGQLAEFRMDNLYFSDQEMAAWLNDQLSLDLPGDHLSLLQQRTEGWVAGLRLLALSLDQMKGAPAERNAFLARLSRSQHYIFDFLVDEVLRYQEAELRTFLLETSILAELTPSLCRAVTGRDDSPHILEELYRRNLFITMSLPGTTEIDELAEVSAGETPGHRVVEIETCYRYHALFAQFLRQQLAQKMPERVRELHHRAAQAQGGSGRAIYHYLAAEMWPEAAGAIEAMGQQRLEAGDLGRLQRWIEALPPAVREERPWLKLLLGTDAVHRGHYEAARPQLEQALTGFQTAGDTTGETEALVQLGEVFICLAQVEQARPVLEQSLQRPLSLRKRIKSQINLVWTAYYQNDWLQMDTQLAETINTVLASGDRGAFHSLILSLGPQHVYGSGGIAPVEHLCRRALQLFGENPNPVQAGAQAYLGYIYALQGKLEEAHEAATCARQTCQQLGGFAHLELYIDQVFLLKALVQADYGAFNDYLESILPRVERVLTYRQWLACYLYLGGRALWLQNRRAELRQLVERVNATQVAYELPEVPIARALLAALVALGEGQYAEAEKSLHQAMKTQQAMRHSLLMTEARLGLAHLYLHRNRPQEALATLCEVLADLEAWGTPGVILQEGRSVIPLLELALQHHLAEDFITPILVLLRPEAGAPSHPAPQSVPLPEGGEIISAREIEVLRLLAEGLTNQEIAAQLIIAPGTVKRHTINIYGKLGVNNRTQAVARARDLNLL